MMDVGEDNSRYHQKAVRKMADERTQFRFDFGGITLELTGEREFVQEMYQCVMEDVQEARARAAQEPGAGRRRQGRTRSGQIKEAVVPPRSIWVHRADQLMRKIYMVSEEDVARSKLAAVLDESYISSIFVDKPLFETFFPHLDSGQTLWAEFTRAGRERLATATRPKMEVMKVPESNS